MRRLLVWAALVPGAASATVHYTVRPDVADLSLNVSVLIDHPKPVESFQIPGWSPGFYVMQHYEGQVSEVEARDPQGDRLKVDHQDPRTWTVTSNGNEPLTFSYQVAGNDQGLGFFAASVKSDSAYYNGASTYMYVLRRRTEDTSLHLEPPMGWKVATALDQIPNGDRTAPDYDTLADYPVQMGHFLDHKFTVQGIPFEIACVLPPGEKMRFDFDNQAEVMKRVSAPVIQMFGGAPFSRYLYILHLTRQGFQGGLEHRSGAVIAIENSSGMDISDLIAHEEFHAWNVKQIRPKPLGPFDYTQPQRTGALWFAEGVTDYYAKILTYRSGVHDSGWLMDELSEQVQSLQTGRTRLSKTVEDASRAVWEDGGFNLGDLDYYNKGLLAGLLFDAEIRNATHGQKSLDDVMRLMFGRYRLPHPGYDENGILDAINEVAGTDLTQNYDLIIRSTGEVPYADLLAIGIEVTSPSSQESLAGGWPLPSESVPPDALQQMGFQEKDQFEGFLPNDGSGSARADVERNGIDVRLQIPLQPAKSHGYAVTAIPTPTTDQAAQYKLWLKRG